MRKKVPVLLLCVVLFTAICVPCKPAATVDAAEAELIAPDTAEREVVYPVQSVTEVAPFFPPVQGENVRRLLKGSSGSSQEESSGLELKKTAETKADGSYRIRLEAYATGESITQIVTEEVPTDVILVLDQSGSMKEQFTSTSDFYLLTPRTNDNYYRNRNAVYYKDGETFHKVTVGRTVLSSEYTYTDYEAAQTNRTYYNASDRLYEKQPDGTYLKITVSRTGNWLSGYNYTYTFPSDNGTVTGSGADTIPDFGTRVIALRSTAVQTIYNYTYTYSNNGENILLAESVGEGADPGIKLYQPLSNVSKLTALQNAVQNFADAVEEKAKEGNIHHRIAVVGFASGNRWNGTNYHYRNTEVLIGADQHSYGTDAQGVYQSAFQDMSTAAGVSNISDSVNALDADGGTLTNLGLEMANGIFAANPVPAGEKRNRVVIVFTDGQPGWSGYDSGIADAAITQANLTKNTYGATVYTIGIFNGADASSAGAENGSGTQKANWFMQQVSGNNGTPQTPSYYLSAANATELNHIFQQISSQIQDGSTSTTLTEEAVIKDIVTPYFNMPENAEAVILKTADYIGENTFAEEQPAADGISADISGDTISVTGFCFKDQWCGKMVHEGAVSYHGKKLIIEFNVTPKDGFLGGNGVPTNGAQSGVYENGSADSPVDTFPVPCVNVPIKTIQITGKDFCVYGYDTLTDEAYRKGLGVKCGDQLINLDPAAVNYGLEPWQNEFVNIIASIHNPGWLTEDTLYTAEVTVAPKTGSGAQSNTGSGNINVFKPFVTFCDSEINLGQTANYADNLVKTEWKHGSTLSTEVTMDSGAEPVLEYGYSPAAGDFTADTPVAVTEVKRKGLDVDYTDYVTFLHAECLFPGCSWEQLYAEGREHENEAQFIVHIKAFDLKITKKGAAPIDENQSFVFHVTGQDGVTVDVIIHGNNSVIIKQLPLGSYTVTEDTGWSWRYEPDTVTKTVAVSDIQNGIAVVCFDNTRGEAPSGDNWKWLNGCAWCDNQWITHTAIHGMASA